MSSTTKILRPSRLAVLECLKAWDSWTTPIVTFAAEDAEVQRYLNDGPQTSRCPYLAVTRLPYQPAWLNHLMQRWPGIVFISIWVPTSAMTLSEDLLEDAVDAVFRHPAPGSSSAAPLALLQKRLADIGGVFPPTIVQMEAGQPEQTGANQQHKLIRSSVALDLKLQKDPMLRATA